jgi:hypothetical protein
MHLAFDGGRLTSDAGLLLLADIERRLGIAERLVRCLAGPRSRDRIHHTVPEMIRFRVLLIAAGYPDANDGDALRANPAFKIAVGRAPESGRDLCSQPTMCRLENLPTITALKRMMAALSAAPTSLMWTAGGARASRGSGLWPDGRAVLRQLRAGAAADRARHR